MTWTIDMANQTFQRKLDFSYSVVSMNSTERSIHLQKKWILLFLLYSVKSYLMRGNFAKIQVFSSRLYLFLCLNGWVRVSECASAQANIRRNDTKQIIWFVSRTSSTFISNKTRNECTYSVCMLFMASNVPFASDWILLS